MLNPQLLKAIQVPKTSKGHTRFAVLIGDESVNKLIKPGSVAIYEPITDDMPLETGKLVVIRRWRGDLEELSVRRVLSLLEGRMKLSDCSTLPKFREVFEIPAGGDDTTEVLGIVVAKYRAL